MFGWMQRHKTPGADVPGLVRWDEVEIIIEGAGGEIARFRWDAVGRIVAFKQDLWAVDRIWLAFEGSGAGGECLGAIHEEASGFRELMVEIGRRFEECDPEWWSKVAFPAFAANATVVWERRNSQG